MRGKKGCGLLQFTPLFSVQTKAFPFIKHFNDSFTRFALNVHVHGNSNEFSNVVNVIGLKRYDISSTSS